MKKAVFALVLCCIAAATVCCGGSSTTVVLVSPSAVSVVEGATQQFSANVPVTWSVEGNGTISPTGLFIAGPKTGSALVTATSGTAGGPTGTASVTVTATTTATTATAPSHIKNRAFVTNEFNGSVQIVDTDNDLVSVSKIVIGTQPTFMLQSTSQASGQETVVYDNSNFSLTQVNDSTEAVAAKATLPGPSNSVTLTTDGSRAFAAVPTAVNGVSGVNVTGAIYPVNFIGVTSGSTTTTTGALGSPIPIAGVQSIAMDNIAANLLAFSTGSNAVTPVNLTTTPPTVGTAVPGFDRPVAAYFTSDNSTAFVLSSGPANGGSQAAVTQVTFPAVGTVSIGQSLNVPGASVALLQGSTLYVTGSASQPCPAGLSITGTCQQVVLSVIDTPTMTVTSQAAYGPIGLNIAPKVMTSDGTNIWIGSTGCSLSASHGCLAIFSPSSGVLNMNVPASGLDDATDDVTGMAWLLPYNNRAVMYVIEGGELLVYQFSGGTLSVVGFIDIVGQASDVKLVR